MWTEEDYFPFQELSYIHMLHTKYLRDAFNRRTGRSANVNFEALEDTLIDMAVYVTAMFAAYIINKKDTH